MKRKSGKKGNFVYRFIGIVLLLSSLLLVGVILYVNVLPMKYLAYLGGGLLLLNIILGFFLFRKRVKRKPKKVASVFAILFTLVFLLGSYYVYKTFGVIETMSKNTRTYTYHVMVLNDSKYEDIMDISGEKLGYYNNNSNSLKVARAKLKEKVTTKEETYGNLDGLGSSLLDKKSDAILVEDTQKSILEKASDMVLDNTNTSTSSSLNSYGGEAGSTDSSSSIESNTNLSGFSSKTRVLYTFKVEAKVDSKEVDVTKDVFNVYISGMDEYGKVKEVSRSDVNIILTVNPKTKQILITNIPRDYYLQLHDTIGYKDKLTHAGTYGIDTSVKTLEDLLGIEINYYVKVNFSSLKNIVNALDGVQVYSEYDFRSWNGYNFSKGVNKVNGKQALAFVRERKSFQDGDNQRGKNQQAMIEAIFKKCTSPSIITNYNSLLNSLIGSMLTNMSTKSMTSVAKMQLKDNAKWTITSQSLTGTGDSNYTYTAPGQLLYVTIPDEDSINKAKDNMKKVADGEKLTSSYNYNSGDVHSVTKSYVPKSSVTYSSNTTKKKTKSTKTSKTTKKNTTSTTKKTTAPTTSTKKTTNTGSGKTNTGSNTGGSNTGGSTGGGSNTGGSNTGGSEGGSTGGDSGGSAEVDNGDKGE